MGSLVRTADEQDHYYSKIVVKTRVAKAQVFYRPVGYRSDQIDLWAKGPYVTMNYWIQLRNH